MEVVLTLRARFTGYRDNLNIRIVDVVVWGEHRWSCYYDIHSFHDCPPFFGRFASQAKRGTVTHTSENFLD